MEKHIVKTCKIHGDYKFVLEGRGYYRCIKCRSDNVQRRRDKVKQLAVEYKGGKCIKCNYNTYVGALEFHHLDSSKKDFGIANKGYTKSWEKIKLELDKCILVCSNCHREIHGL